MVVTPIAQQETMVVVPAIRQRLLDLLTFRIEENGERERERSLPWALSFREAVCLIG